MKRTILTVAAAALAAFAVAGCGAVGHEAIDQQAASSATAKNLFTSNCGGCHVLKDAGTQGTTGPNLDDAWACAAHQGFHRSTFRDVVRGQIDYATPPMPRGILKGKDADDVADYVATVAGKGMSCTSPEPESSSP